MYCINCGEKLVDGAKFCHRCGTKQPFIPHSSTRSYPPVRDEDIKREKPLDGPRSIEETMHSTSDLVDLIQQVDEKINIDLTLHSRDQGEENPNFIGPKKPKDLSPQPTGKTQPVTKIDQDLEEAKSLDPKQEKIESSEPPAKEKAKDPSQGFVNKLKAGWQKFIHEEDDEYSIFSALKNKSTPQEDIQRNISDAEKLPMETIEQKASPESIDFSKDADLLEEIVVKKKIDQKKIADLKKSELENKERLEKIRQRNLQLKPKESDDYIFYPDSFDHMDFDNMEKLEEDDLSKSQKIVFTPESLEEESFTDKAKASLKGLFAGKTKSPKDRPKKKETSFLDQFKIKKADKDLLKGDGLEAELSSDPQKPVNQAPVKNEKIDNYMEKVHDRIYDGLEKLHATGQKGVLFLAIIGLVFCLLPVALVGRSFSAIIYGILKVLITAFIFHTAHKVAFRSVRIQVSKPLQNLGCLANWTLCQVVLAILFLLYPRQATLGFNMLGALTPTIWATLIYYCITCLFAQGLLWHRLKGVAKVQFLGWYAISFITLDLISKLIWILLNFILSFS